MQFKCIITNFIANLKYETEILRHFTRNERTHAVSYSSLTFPSGTQRLKFKAQFTVHLRRGKAASFPTCGNEMRRTVKIIGAVEKFIFA